MKHPQERISEIRIRAEDQSEVRVPPAGWRCKYGWLIVLVADDGAKSYRDTHPDADYAEACRVRDTEMAMSDRYRKSWLIQKMYAPEEILAWQRRDIILRKQREQRRMLDIELHGEGFKTN